MDKEKMESVKRRLKNKIYYIAIDRLSRIKFIQKELDYLRICVNFYEHELKRLLKGE